MIHDPILPTFHDLTQNPDFDNLAFILILLFLSLYLLLFLVFLIPHLLLQICNSLSHSIHSFSTQKILFLSLKFFFLFLFFFLHLYFRLVNFCIIGMLLKTGPRAKPNLPLVLDFGHFYRTRLVFDSLLNRPAWFDF